MRDALLVSFVVVAGCTDGPELEESEVTEHIVGEHEQGRYILGEAPDALMAGGIHFRVSAIPNNRQGFKLSVKAAGWHGTNGTHLVADDGVTSYAGTNLWFDGLIMDGPGGQLLVRRSAPIGTSILSTVYFLDYRQVLPGYTGPWGNYCGSGGGGAIPLSGSYDSERVHRLGPSISFACVDGVARKCNGWGYIAGNAGPGNLNWDHHQACTGMANANYCGTGQPFTREKTPILIRDNVSGYGNEDPNNFGHPMTLPGNPDTYYIEAGWLDNGRPLCLSKVRWAGLAPNQCASVLPDPRFSNDPEAKFCDDWTIPELFAAGAVLVNGSKMMDAPLHRWRNLAGDDVSTIRGYFIDRNLDGYADAESIPPFPGYTVHVGTAGMLLRNLPGNLLETQMRPLYLQNLGAGDRYLNDAGGGRADPGFEGYSFLSRITTTTTGETFTGFELNQCDRGADLDTVLGTSLGCTFLKSLSYALPAP